MIERIILKEIRRITRTIIQNNMLDLAIKIVNAGISQEISGLQPVFPREYKFVNWSYNSFDKTFTCAKCGWSQFVPCVEEALRVYEKHQLGIPPWPKCPAK